MISSIQYARWSDPSQGKGATKARQFGKMREEARRLGYTCHREIFDDGRSAFHGHHIERGEFGKLLEEIDSGAYIGWVLQFENIDRLSRQGDEVVVDLVRRITRAGVSLHTCDGDHLEAYKRVEVDQIIVLSIKADLARKEAEKRSGRAADSWAIRRAGGKTGKAIPGVGPTWIERVGDDFKVKEQRFAAQTARIWEISDETGHGSHTVTRLLNEEGVPMFDTGKPWYASRVDLILSGMEVIGYHQPRRKEGRKWVPDGEPIKIYPTIIPHDLFERVRSASAARLETHGGGRSPKIANLMSGLCRCQSCGASMRLAGSTSGGYLMCGGRDRGLCGNRVAYRYGAFEATVLNEFLHLALDDNAFANKTDITRLNIIIAEREVAHEVKVQEAMDHLRRASKSALSERLGLEAETEADAIAENLRALRCQREAAKGRASAAEHFARVKDMRGKLADDINLRRKVLQAFNSVIESVTFGVDGIAVVRLVRGIMELKIDFEGNAVEGCASLTTNEQLLLRHRDQRVINLARRSRSDSRATSRKGLTGRLIASPQHEPAAAGLGGRLEPSSVSLIAISLGGWGRPRS